MDISKAAAAYQQASGMGGVASKVENALGNAATESKDKMGPSFADLVSEGLEGARSTGYKTEATSVEALANKSELQDLVTAVSNAELTLNTVIAVRDRMISAYQDILKMPI